MRNPLGGHDVVGIAKATFKEFKEDDLQGSAAEIAYHILFSTVPLMLFLTALTSFVSRQIGVDNVMDDITEWLRDNLPDETADAVLGPIETVIKTQAGGILSFGALTALWGGKNAMAAMIKGLNVAFDAKESRPWWRKQLVSVGLTLGLGGAIILASVIFVVGASGGRVLAEFVGLSETWTTVWSLLQWPLIVVLLVTALAAFYWAAPNVNADFKWLTPGSVLAVIAWALATIGLSYYFANFAGYTAYGTLGAVMAFVFWLYVMSLILLLGGELNAVVGRLSGEVVPAAPAGHKDRGAATGIDERDQERTGGLRAGHAAHPDASSSIEPDPRSPADHAAASGGSPVHTTSAKPVAVSRPMSLGTMTWRTGWKRIVGRGIAGGAALARRLGWKANADEAGAATAAPQVGASRIEQGETVAPTRAAFSRWDDRTVGELRAAVAAGVVAKTELQLYGLDWSQLATERNGTRLEDVFARRGVTVSSTEARTPRD